MKNKNRRASSANGVLDGYAIRAEEYSSYITRTRIPPQVALTRIMNLAEKAQQYQYTRVNDSGNVVPENRSARKSGQEAQRQRCLDRIWAAYEVVLNNEVMHPSKSGKDESWNNATRDTETGKWVSDPIIFFDNDTLERVAGDEMYGYKAQGRTPIRNSNYNGDEGGND